VDFLDGGGRDGGGWGGERREVGWILAGGGVGVSKADPALAEPERVLLHLNC
jgi:hypothetical protein